ncbi:ABC transporter ATP-binding protein [Streptomyces marianii]|uniref:ABC transporter ATP-binding protein n=1 Tax=Streptomyces marianii TaxID=1817406 RepID=A0A5R9DZS1_9ACTN|nr:ABC transporter ATP-binding protein [Streptomyces marianii]TLQ43158.1 ABC transporter ATP-binding protein [Streptomyces marianii]
MPAASPDSRRRGTTASLRSLTENARFAAQLAWRADRRSLLQVLMAQLVSALGLLVVLLLVRHAIGGALPAVGGGPASGPQQRWLIPLLAGMVALGTGAGVLRVIAAARQRILAVKVDQYAVAQVLRAANRAELAEFEDPVFHDRLQRAVFASRSQPTMVVTALIGALQAVLTVGAVGAVFALTVWWLFPLALLSTLPTLQASRKERSAGYDLHHSLSENRRARQYLERLLTGRDEAKEIRSLGLGSTLRNRWSQQFRQEIEQVEDMHRAHVRRKITARLSGDLMTASVIAAMWWLVSVEAIGLPTAITALVGLWQISLRMQMIGALLNGLGESVLYLQDLRSFGMAPDGADAPQRPAEQGAFVALQADSVGFSYPGSAAPALKGVDVTLRAGEIVALVGVNGSGKTTLAKILAGLYRPSHGRLEFNGQPDPDPEQLRRTSAVVFQDFVRYKLPAVDNITYGRPEAQPDRERAALAAEHAGAHAFLTRLPDGYDTVLSKEFSEGSDLSLGQWQRLALARAFYRDSDFVVLDEPTASLDPQAEADLFGHIRELFAGRTVLLITHRFANVREADRIYVLDAGRIVEQGDHDCLLAADGMYARLYRLQAEAYQDAYVPGQAAGAAVAQKL